MKSLLFKKYCRFLSFLSFMLSSPLLLAGPRIPDLVVEREHEGIDEISQEKYVSLEQEDELYLFLSEIRSLDKNKNSPLYELCNHVENGFSVWLLNDILEVLEYAESLFYTRKLQGKKGLKKYATRIAQLKENLGQEKYLIRRPCSNKFLRCVKTVERLNVLRNALFNRDVRIGRDLQVDRDTVLNGNLTVFGEADFENTVTFQDDVTFNHDIFLNGNLSVTETIVTTHIGTQTLSAVDAVIDNLTVTNCIAAVCVSNLSIADATINTLSATDAFITNAQI